MDEGLVEYYSDRRELDRLEHGSGLFEAARTQELLSRYLPSGAALLDVGGAGGYYAEWLARSGHSVRLLDPVPLHVAEARRRAGTPQLFEAEVGEAGNLPALDASVDAVLLLGPLYHLTKRDDRLQALCEAARVCVPGGLIFAAAISRLAPPLDGIGKGWIVDEHKLTTVKLQMRDGASGDHQDGFPAVSYFHSPDELMQEASDSGLAVEGVYGLEGPTWFLPDIEARWHDVGMRERMLWLARELEREPSALALSAHLLLVARV